MDTQVIAAIIGAGGAVVAAAVGVAAVWSKRDRPSASVKNEVGGTAAKETVQSVAFVDIKIATVVGVEWYEGKEIVPAATQGLYQPSAGWYFHKADFNQGADLPLEATVLNSGNGPIVISRVGVKLVKGINSWYSGKYYGTAPQAERIEISGSYEIRLPESPGVRAIMSADPDEDTWRDIGEICGIPLADPLYLRPGVPFRYTLNLKRYDVGMPTHTVLRLWLRTNAGEVTSGDILAVFGR
jgi:hypothetical protein